MSAERWSAISRRRRRRANVQPTGGRPRRRHVVQRLEDRDEVERLAAADRGGVADHERTRSSSAARATLVTAVSIEGESRSSQPPWCWGRFGSARSWTARSRSRGRGCAEQGRCAAARLCRGAPAASPPPNGRRSAGASCVSCVITPSTSAWAPASMLRSSRSPGGGASTPPPPRGRDRGARGRRCDRLPVARRQHGRQLQPRRMLRGAVVRARGDALGARARGSRGRRSVARRSARRGAGVRPRLLAVPRHTAAEARAILAAAGVDEVAVTGDPKCWYVRGHAR